jgi:hypothetical protein
MQTFFSTKRPENSLHFPGRRPLHHQPCLHLPWTAFHHHPVAVSHRTSENIHFNETVLMKKTLKAENLIYDGNFKITQLRHVLKNVHSCPIAGNNYFRATNSIIIHQQFNNLIVVMKQKRRIRTAMFLKRKMKISGKKFVGFQMSASPLIKGVSVPHPTTVALERVIWPSLNGLLK